MPRKTTVVPVARRMPDGRLGIVEKHMTSEKKLSKTEQLAQATAMMQRRLFDPAASISNLAEEFGLCRETVTARLAMARNDGVPDQAREVFIHQMLPLSMAVLLEALNGEDKKLAAQVAMKVIDGLKAMELPEQDKPALGSDDDSLEIWRERIKVVRRQDNPAAVPSASTADDRGTIEALPVLASESQQPDATPAEDTSGTGTAGSEGSISAVALQE